MLQPRGACGEAEAGVWCHMVRSIGGQWCSPGRACGAAQGGLWCCPGGTCGAAQGGLWHKGERCACRRDVLDVCKGSMLRGERMQGCMLKG